MQFKYFKGYIDKNRRLEKDERSKLKYRSNSGDFVELTKDEFQELCESYAAYVLKILFLRDRACTHYRWVNEPALKYKRLSQRCNGYRDPARKAAFEHAYQWLKGNNYVQEAYHLQDDKAGPKAKHVSITSRGMSYFKEYCNWFSNEFGKSYYSEPEHHQFVDENGMDKDESTEKFPVFANKKLNIV